MGWDAGATRSLVRLPTAARGGGPHRPGVFPAPRSELQAASRHSVATQGSGTAERRRHDLGMRLELQLHFVCCGHVCNVAPHHHLRDIVGTTNCEARYLQVEKLAHTSVRARTKRRLSMDRASVLDAFCR